MQALVEAGADVRALTEVIFVVGPFLWLGKLTKKTVMVVCITHSMLTEAMDVRMIRALTEVMCVRITMLYTPCTPY